MKKEKEQILEKVLLLTKQQIYSLASEKLMEGRQQFTDMELHLHVCNDLWPGGGLANNYFDYLEEILCRHSGSKIDDPPCLYSLVDYQDGDFARAALVTLLDYESWCESPEGQTARKRIVARKAAREVNEQRL